MRLPSLIAVAVALPFAPLALGSAGDPQVKTDHPYYPGELACSTFERLFKTQAEAYERATGRKVETEQDKVLASWYWRNLHFAHAEEGKCDLWGQGFSKTDSNREYWFGLFAHGFALCGTTHAQYNGEIEALLGHARSRTVGVSGHNSFEVFLTGGAYGAGRWALLDHDISTVIFDDAGERLLGLDEITPRIKTLKDPRYKPERQHGWRVAGLHDDDAGGVYTAYNVAEYLSGYAGVPPMVHLRPGETLRRYLRPGLEDGKTFVYWGMNYNQAGVPGPARDRTWVNQPEAMYNSKKGTGWHPGQARYGNAVYTYVPNFADGSYKEGVVGESGQQVTFEFYTPYVIGATPANDKKWGIYDAGGRNGLVVTAAAPLNVEVSTDQGKTWKPAGPPAAEGGTNRYDLTDAAKGHAQYLLRVNAGAEALKSSNLSIRTVCQTNGAVLPRLREGANRITFAASGQAVVSAGPTQAQAEAHVVDGAIGSKAVTLELAAPRGEKAVRVYAASWQASGAPPREDVKYQIEYSADGGKTWATVVRDWQVTRRKPEPKDFWSQSFTWGDVAIPVVSGPVRVRFSNNGGKTYRKVEAHLVYQVSKPSPTTVTFAWKAAGGELKTASHTYATPTAADDASWTIDAGKGPETAWVEFAVK